MNTDELIVTDSLIESKFEELIVDSVKYAILSIPFTYDRLGIRDLHSKILNIAKGKAAESIFFEYCKNTGYEVSTARTTTPFHDIDKRDFEYGFHEWDIKNNFLEHENDLLELNEYLSIPCLIPNRGPWDQWSKRDKLFFNNSNGLGYVFTFMKKSDPRQPGTFFDFHISFKQELFIRDLYDKYQGKHQPIAPYPESWFFDTFTEIDSQFSVDIKMQSRMIIAGTAQDQDFGTFRQMLPSQVESRYIHTIIENMGCKVIELPSFLETFQKIKNG